MNNFSILIENIQHIKKLEFSLDINKSGLIAIIGKNGVGKTMLFKGIQNLITSNTFAKTSNKYIYKDNSTILYTIDNTSYKYTYNKAVETLDYNGEIDKSIKENIYVELPIPFGERFQQLIKLSDKGKVVGKLGDIDKDIRASIDTEIYNKPVELIELLNYIYDTDRFNNLIEIQIKREKYYAIPLANNYYIREDYLSSAEYFIISIYKMIQRKCKFIAIDEIDISLDAMAQVRLIEKLQDLTEKYHIKILFSTHSLALIKTLKDDELYYMDLNEGIASFEKKSYNYIKSLLYGFKDYDKYILTEDSVLKRYMQFLLKDENIFSEYIILYIGGASNTTTLMEINKSKEIFSKEKNVCTVLDGDVKEDYFGISNIFFIPFQSIEKDLFLYFNDGCGFIDFTNIQLRQYNVSNAPKAKEIYKMILREKIKTEHDIFQFLSDKKPNEVEIFKQELLDFLNPMENTQ